MILPTQSFEISQLEANLCYAFADPTRIMILHLLGEQPRNVTELTIALKSPQPTISRHLKILRDHGLVQAARKGVCVTYTLVDHRLLHALDILRMVLRDTIRSKANLVIDIDS